jgi:hypothetical protein
MLFRTLLVATAFACALPAVIIDRIAVVVGNSIVKDSDVNRDLRVTSFLNGEPLTLTDQARRVVANRLIDQIFIRKEIEIGDYTVATRKEADQQLEQLVKQRFKNEAALQKGLRRYGITAPDLRSHFLWQITVLRFIDTRFRPAVLVPDSDIEKYYKEHASALQKEHPGKASLDDVRGEINDILIAQRVDKIFFAWLDDQKKQTKIKYFERALQ